MLHLEHFFFNRLDQRKIAVDDKVEQSMQYVINAMHEQRWRCFQLFAKRLVGPQRSVTDANDVGRANEDGGLTVTDAFLLQPGGAGDDEQLLAIDVNLGQLVGVECVLDR